LRIFGAPYAFRWVIILMTPCPLEKFWTAFPLILSMPLIFMDHMWRKQFLYFDNPGCPGQLTCTTTNSRIHWISCKPSRQVRHRGDNKYACRGLNPGCRMQDASCRMQRQGIFQWSGCYMFALLQWYTRRFHAYLWTLSESTMDGTFNSTMPSFFFFFISTLLIINFVILY
jgi:hypothetical protein